jgi:hypothetical protein
MVKRRSTQYDLICACEGGNIGGNLSPVGHSEMLSIMAGGNLTTCRNPDVQAGPLRMAACVLSVRFSEETSIIYVHTIN